MTFLALREKYAEAPPHAVYAALFARNVLNDEGMDYPISAAFGRYATCQDIVLSGEELAWADKILAEFDD